MYQPNSGQVNCIPASPGSFVATTGAIQATPCLAGTYQSNSGAVSCIQASPGYYVPNAGAIEQIQCPSGFTSLAGATVCTPISPTFNFSGFFQPVDNLPTVNQVKAGSSIPIKFSLGGNQGLNIMAAGYPASQPINCSSECNLRQHRANRNGRQQQPQLRCHQRYLYLRLEVEQELGGYLPAAQCHLE